MTLLLTVALIVFAFSLKTQITSSGSGLFTMALLFAMLTQSNHLPAATPELGQPGQLLVGWGAADITPPGVLSMAGGSRARIAAGIMDPLTATALILESENGEGEPNRVVLISVDIGLVQEEMLGAIREEVAHRLPAIDVDSLVIFATHTHAGPERRTAPDIVKKLGELGIEIPIEWSWWGVDLGAVSPLTAMRFAADGIVDAIEMAWKNRAPGGVAFGLGHAVVGHNRLTRYKDGTSKMYGITDNPDFSHLEGHEDHSVGLIYTFDTNGILTGVVFNIACPAQVTEGGTLISADFMHETREELRRRLGESLYVLPQISAAGDQSPRVRIDNSAEERMQRIMFPELNISGNQTVARRHQIAVRIADAVTSVLPYVREHIDWNPVLAHRVEQVGLTRRRLPEVDTAAANFKRLLAEFLALREKLEKHPEIREQENWFRDISNVYWHLCRASRVLDRYELQHNEPKLFVPIHVIRIGDAVMATNPFELYLDYGSRIKARSKAVQTFVVQLTDGYYQYLPTERAVAGGGYGGIPESNQVGPEGGSELVEATLKLIESLFIEKFDTGSHAISILTTMNNAASSPSNSSRLSHERDIKPTTLTQDTILPAATPELDQPGQLLVGWGTADITPEGPVVMSGGRRARISTGVMDPISVTALALESVSSSGDSQGPVVQVSVDVSSIRGHIMSFVTQKMAERVPEIKPEQLIFFATHTHAAPDTRPATELAEKLETLGIEVPRNWTWWGIDLEVTPSPREYAEFVSTRIVDAVRQALDNRAPGGVAFGLGHAVAGHNRLTAYKDGTSKMYGSMDRPDFSHPEGYEDHSLGLLYTFDEDKNLTGVVTNIACTAQVTEGGTLVSADFWHETRVELRKRLGESIYLLPQIAAAGDQSPLVLADASAEERMQRIMFPDLQSGGRRSEARRQQIAVRIVDAVTSLLPYLKKHIEWNPILVQRTEMVELPRLGISEEERQRIQNNFDHLLAEYLRMRQEIEDNPDLKRQPGWANQITPVYWNLRQAWRVLEPYARNTPTITVPVHVIRIGDMVIATNPFELYIDYGARIKARSKATQTFIVQLANGGYGYLPTERSVAGGAYGAIPESNEVGPEGGAILVEKTLEIINPMFQ